MKVSLYHYYEATRGPFKNLSALPQEEAQTVMDSLKQAGNVFASKRPNDYLTIRRQLEERARQLFVGKGGKPVNAYPHYMTLGECEWLKEWYTQGVVVEIPLEAFDPETISFTYGDLFPTMRFLDGKPYREMVYRKDEIENMIEQYGWPQVWNQEGAHGPERYIEVQIWEDRIIQHFLRQA